MLIKIVSLISEACRNAEKLPMALMSAGALQAASALALTLYEAPGGILLHHGRAPVYMYYGVLIAIVIFGLVEAYAGFCSITLLLLAVGKNNEVAMFLL